MQASDVSSIPNNSRLIPPGSKYALNGDTGFSHGAYNNNHPNPIQGFSDRNTRRANIPSINTAAGQHSDMASGFDMNYTPCSPPSCW
ncbi:hypothetical protein N7471_000952 [Penicillium samsonianum]|uniref:uncharacterized protein n=1 Tax=Penicillium samsonianum TaxID=1882272 RepID=UPI002547BA4F|nr:uncharacterized protein N7471_000952 [Penicillium samsonianum]KAJ6149753.1 hypothetical protein N7471_000952 [Penicillium samsonianum]